jgi:hypothetical protein
VSLHCVGWLVVPIKIGKCIPEITKMQALIGVDSWCTNSEEFQDSCGSTTTNMIRTVVVLDNGVPDAAYDVLALGTQLQMRHAHSMPGSVTRFKEFLSLTDIVASHPSLLRQTPSQGRSRLDTLHGQQSSRYGRLLSSYSTPPRISHWVLHTCSDARLPVSQRSPTTFHRPSRIPHV